MPSADSEAMLIVRRMVRTMLHEIKNPLSSIILSLEVIRLRIGDDERHRPLLTEVVCQLRSLTSTLDNLGRLSQPWELHRQSFEIAAIVKSLLQEERFAAVQCQAPTEPCVAVVDPQAIQELCRHLLNNAVEASAEQQPIEVRLQADTEQVKLWIIDHGAGMEPAIAEQAFEPFFTTKHRRLGVGLSLARRIAREHGGEVSLRTEASNGTIAEVVLPRHAGAPGPDP